MWGNYTNDGLLERSHFPVLVWKIYHLQCHNVDNVRCSIVQSQ
jgi:hypothetical protein